MYSKILHKIKSQEGVLDAFVLDPATRLRMEMEESKNSSTGCRYTNIGLEESRSMDVGFCVFSESYIELPTQVYTLTEEAEKELVSMRKSPMKSHEPVCQASETGVQLRVVLVPHGLKFLEEEDGVEKAIGFNPAPATDRYLRGAYGFEGSENTMSTIISVNLVH